MPFATQILARLANRRLRHVAGRIPRSRGELLLGQERVWARLRDSLKGTAIYRDLDLGAARSYAQFLQHVPVNGYDFYQNYVTRLESGEHRVLFLDDCADIGLTSGTGGYDAKRIPLNTHMLRSFKAAQTLLAGRVTLLERGAIDFLQFDHLTFGSAPSLYRKGALNYGYISGILTSRVPAVLRNRTCPSPRVIGIADWDEKLDELVTEAVTRNVRIVSGVPSYILAIFERVLQRTGAREIRQVWPDLEVFIYAGTPLGPHRQRIDQLVGRNMHYYGFYTCTEAAIGVPYRVFPGTCQLYLLNPNLLVSFSLPGQARAIGIGEVRCGVRYLVNLGTPNGFVHYGLEDFVEFEEADGALAFKVVGRKSEGVNLAGEKVVLDDLIQALQEVVARIAQQPRHFFVVPAIDERGRPAYGWTLFLPDPAALDRDACAAALDDSLQRRNLDYRDCRKVGVIGRPLVSSLDARLVDGVFARNRNKGQFKLKTVFATEEERRRFIREDLGAAGACA